jgi:sulfur-carrier protein adenylyltransferase/sulfurtransferase
VAQYLIPASLRKLTGGQSCIATAGANVGETLMDLVAVFPDLGVQLLAADGQPRPFVNLFVNGDDIRMHDDLATLVRPDDEIEILPAIAGGEADARSFAGWRADLEVTVPQCTVEDLQPGQDATLVLDVRTAEEFALGHIPGAVHCDRGFLEIRIEDLVADRRTRIVCYCQSGLRSLFAAQTLQVLGYSKVSSLSGGFGEWKVAGKKIEIPARLTETQRQRYLRHVGIGEVGEAGQHRLLRSRVLMIGAGGLGCPSALYLAAAGVGTIGIVDNDVVDLSNLQRQILHRTDGVGRPKVESARDAIQALNPDVSVEMHDLRLSEAEAAGLFAQYDVIVDGSDNFRTRYLINDTAIGLGLPVVHGSVHRFEGQVTVFGHGDGPCYRCLHPVAPPPELAPSCAEAGVLGVLPGVIGLLQATETLKLLLGIGEPLAGRALRFDGLAGRFRELRFARDPHCPACGAGDRNGLSLPGEAACAIPAVSA